MNENGKSWDEIDLQDFRGEDSGRKRQTQSVGGKGIRRRVMMESVMEGGQKGKKRGEEVISMKRTVAGKHSEMHFLILPAYQFEFETYNARFISGGLWGCSIIFNMRTRALYGFPSPFPRRQVSSKIPIVGNPPRKILQTWQLRPTLRLEKRPIYLAVHYLFKVHRYS